MTDIVTTVSNLNQKKVRKMAFDEWRTSHELAPFIGTDENAVIHRQIDTSKGRGDTIYFSLRGALSTSAVVRGTTQLEGQEQQDTLYDDAVVIDNIRSAMTVENSALVNLRTPIELLGKMRPQLLDQHARVFRDDIIGSAEITATPNRTRVLFGASDANYNATLATALATIDTTADKLSVAMIKIAVNKARNVASASAGVTSRQIKPSQIAMTNGAMKRTFVMLVGAEGAAQLQADADFKDLRDDNRANLISMPYFDASDYLGMVDGCMIYRVDALSLLDRAGEGAGASNVAHALLCGAQAFGVAVGNPGRFVRSTQDDYEFNPRIGYHVIRGVKMLSFNSVEQGVVHVFHSKG